MADAVTTYDSPTIGGWTDDVDAAVQTADSQHIPLVMILSKSDAICSLCANFNSHVFDKSEFQSHMQTRRYIGVKVVGKNGDWSGYNKMRVYVKGVGTLPGISLYWKKADGTFLDPTSISIHANYHNGPQWFIDWMEGYLSGYDGSGTTITPTPVEPEKTMTNIVAKVLNQSISVFHPDYVTEGENGYLQFSRSGDTENELTVHVLTNGFWLSDVSWGASDTAVKQIPVAIGHTDEFDHGRNVTISVRTLDSSVKTSD